MNKAVLNGIYIISIKDSWYPMLGFIEHKHYLW